MESMLNLKCLLFPYEEQNASCARQMLLRNYSAKSSIANPTPIIEEVCIR